MAMGNLFSVRAIGITRPLVLDLPTTEDLIVYQARVSAPANQEKMLAGEKVVATEKFIQSCKDRGEWSVFQMVNVNLEITGPCDITRQFTRHASMLVVEIDDDLEFHPDGIDQQGGGIQEFSQRYAAVPGFLQREGRLAHPNDRQSSVEDLETDEEASASNAEILARVKDHYENRLFLGEAKETARVILPEGLTTSRLYVNATVRSWLHFLDAREKHVTQKEHRELAGMIRQVLHEQLPGLF